MGCGWLAKRVRKLYSLERSRSMSSEATGMGSRTRFCKVRRPSGPFRRDATDADLVVYRNAAGAP
jgi:hypothetical protein